MRKVPIGFWMETSNKVNEAGQTHEKKVSGLLMKGGLKLWNVNQTVFVVAKRNGADKRNVNIGRVSMRLDLLLVKEGVVCVCRAL